MKKMTLLASLFCVSSCSSTETTTLFYCEASMTTQQCKHNNIPIEVPHSKAPQKIIRLEGSTFLLRSYTSQTATHSTARWRAPWDKMLHGHISEEDASTIRKSLLSDGIIDEDFCSHEKQSYICSYTEGESKSVDQETIGLVVRETNGRLVADLMQQFHLDMEQQRKVQDDGRQY